MAKKLSNVFSSGMEIQNEIETPKTKKVVMDDEKPTSSKSFIKDMANLTEQQQEEAESNFEIEVPFNSEKQTNSSNITFYLPDFVQDKINKLCKKYNYSRNKLITKVIMAVKL